MTIHSFQCPSCGAPLLPKGKAPVISCPHCLTSVIVPEELRQVSDTEQWDTFLFDNFATNENNWLVGSQTSEYFTPLNQIIADGRYRWDAQIYKHSGMSTAWLMGYPVTDFHLSVNCKHIIGSKTASSWGVIFRVQDNQNFHWFRMTDNQYFAVSVVKDSQWLNKVNWTRTDAIKPFGVNQLEVIARGTHLVFLINGQLVSEFDDDQFSQRLVGLAIEGYTSGERTVFDFMDVILRAP